MQARARNVDLSRFIGARVFCPPAPPYAEASPGGTPGALVPALRLVRQNNPGGLHGHLDMLTGRLNESRIHKNAHLH